MAEGIESVVDSSKDKTLGISDLGYNKQKRDELKSTVEAKRKQYILELGEAKKPELGVPSRRSFSVFSSPLRTEINNVDRELRFEEYKKSDDQDLKEAVGELETDGMSLRSSHDPSKEMLVISRSEGEVDFTTDDRSFDENTESILEYRKKDVVGKVLTHTTRHMDSIIKQRGLATRSWIQKNDPKYRSESLKSVEGRSGSEHFSPMNEDDEDVIYFSNDFVDNYGEEGVAFMSDDILLDSGLVFQLDRAFGGGEVAVSDVCTQEKDKIPGVSDPEYGSSNLKLSLDKAVLFFPKSQYKERCKELLKIGYSIAWVRDHTFSYRGVLIDRDVKGAVTDEIRKRMAGFGRKSDPTKVQISPNPSVVPHNAHLFQLTSVGASRS